MVLHKSRNSLTLSNFHMQHNLYYYCYSYSCSSSIKCKRGFVARSFRSFAKGFFKQRKVLMWYQKYEFRRENILSIVHKDHLNAVQKNRH